MRKSVEVKPDVIVEKNRNGKLCMCKLRANSWTVRQRSAFFDHLAATCNVRASAQAVGVLAGTGYRMYRRDPEFAKTWDEALATGYIALETMLVARAMGALQMPQGETEIPDASTMDTEIALRVLGQHKRAVKANAKQGGPRLQRATEEQTNVAILKALRALAKRKGIEIR